MPSFRVCARRALHTWAERPSHAWIALHRCVEGLARLTGEPFTSIFDRMGKLHGFGRAPEDWPDASQIRAAATTLTSEHEAWLARYRALVARRREEKRAGIRHPRVGELDQIEARRRAHVVPAVGYWGWRRRREGG